MVATVLTMPAAVVDDLGGGGHRAGLESAVGTEGP